MPEIEFYKISKFPIIYHVGQPFNLLTCTPPKSGTTSWMRGVAVLKDKINEIHHRPEDYVPRQLFYMRKGDCFNPYSFQTKITETNSNFTDWTKITAVRNPFDRLYSAWKDKSRTFRFENGTINWEKAIAETTWAWGTEKMTEREKSKILKKALKQHDKQFDTKIFGIDQFEDSYYSQSYFQVEHLYSGVTH